MRTIVVFVAILLCSCDQGSEAKDFSTVDSTLVNQADSNPALLYLDNPNDSNFSIAVDSSGNTIDGTEVQQD